MTDETLLFIHDSYQKALEQASNILEIVKNLYCILDKSEVCAQDSEQFDAFLDGLRGCIKMRENTFVITNFVSYFIIATIYVIQWLNETTELQYDVVISARRKSLKSDLRKTLETSIQNADVSASVRDRFGIRIWSQNSLTKEDAIKHIDFLFDCIKGIFAYKNRKLRKDFVSWFENNQRISAIDKIVVSKVLQVPFCIEFLKDYIRNPKENGYESLQFIMTVPMYAEIVPGGTMFEVQLRSHEMHLFAENGPASHDDYKSEQMYNDIFCVDDFDKLNIAGFTDTDDEDGIGIEKVFSSRRISHSLVR